MNRSEEKKLIKQIIHMMQKKALKTYKHKLIKRSAHAKGLATLKATFHVSETIPNDLRLGIFEQQISYPAWVRISNSSAKGKQDSKKDVRGFALKLMLDGQPQDFILVSTKHMPLRDLEGFHAAVSLISGVRPLKAFTQLIKHTNFQQLFRLVTSMEHETSPLDLHYFSITPYRYGDKVVKYCIVPTSNYKSEKPQKLTPIYLRENMKKHLTAHRATFDLMVQFQKEGMSISDASDEWDEQISPLIKVGEIVIEPQSFDTVPRKRLGEQLTFSPTHAVPQHYPVGGLNRARGMIYQEMQDFRKKLYAKGYY